MALLLIIALLLVSGSIGVVSPSVNAATQQTVEMEKDNKSTTSGPLKEGNGTPDFSVYMEQATHAARPEKEWTIPATENYTTSADCTAEIAVLDERAALITGDTGSVTWRFTVEESGYYDLFFCYYPIEGKGATIERALYLDGALPFDEARDLVFQRIWKDDGEKIYSSNGNEHRRPQVEIREWNTVRAISNATYNDDGLSLYLEKGEHTLSLEAVAEPLALAEILFRQEPEVLPYDKVLQNWQAQGYQPYTGETVKLQAEDAYRKSANTLYAVENRTSTITEPFDLTLTQLNCIGGTNWKYKHQWIEWEITVPQDALYTISMRALQDFMSGGNAYRRLTIDGALPFAEAESLAVSYSMDWQVFSLGAQQPYLFYLEEGKHTLRMTVVLGDIYSLLTKAGECVTELNRLYRDILTITGSVPDTYRDYDLEERIPQMMQTIEKNVNRLKEIRAEMEQLSNSSGEYAVYVNQLLVQLESFLDRPKTIPTRLAKLSENLNALASWLTSASEVGLLIDSLLIGSPNAELPPADAGFFESLWQGVRAFFISFFHDYYTIDSFREFDGEPTGSVTLWLGGTSGRDQANILKNLADFYFTDQTGIQLNIKLVEMDALLRSVASNSGPDVALFQGQSQAVNYGIRGAAYNLNNFADVQKVTARFDDSALIPLQYGGKLYALPEQQNFLMMFCRTDVLEEVGVTVPNTWEEFYRVIPVLNEKNYSIGLPTPAGVQSGSASSDVNELFSALLLQGGAAVYNKDGSRCVLDSLEGIDAFVKWSEFYTKYNLPKSFSGINRFRTGEMPIVISSYSFYNSLVVAAPEIQGLWTMVPIPGTLTADGGIDRSVASGVSCAMIFRNADSVEHSWEFLKWWTSAQGQTLYGQEIEALQGGSARWATANLEAMQALPWSTAIAKQIQTQWQYVEGIPEVPGGYYLGRSVDNAIKSVINMGESPRESLLDAVVKINDEMIMKRQEFDLE